MATEHNICTAHIKRLSEELELLRKGFAAKSGPLSVEARRYAVIEMEIKRFQKMLVELERFLEKIGGPNDKPIV